jgi:hypothetical protein
MWPHLIAFALGIWLTAAPYALGLVGPVAANYHVVGPLVATAGLVAVFEATRGVRWVNLPLGVWLAVSPVVLDFTARSILHGGAVGLAVAALACVEGRRSERFGGGWATLWRDDSD